MFRFKPSDGLLIDSITAEISSMWIDVNLPWGPVPITEWRRIHLPRQLREAARIAPGHLVKIDVPGNDPEAIRIRPAAMSQTTLAIRDPGRPRLVTATGQVAIPAEIMTTAGITLSDRVYMMLDRGRRGIRLLPAARVRTSTPGEPAEVTR
ncbi:hypothetical protein ACFV9C_30925 [Kribbella sp. NPDC059898]|uniref:hypothetical protein n=1 Tax=Kribbella sp. NPDC059898 TaxID=3346995 RepID=UPI003661E830